MAMKSIFSRTLRHTSSNLGVPVRLSSNSVSNSSNLAETTAGNFGDDDNSFVFMISWELSQSTRGSNYKKSRKLYCTPYVHISKCNVRNGAD